MTDQTYKQWFSLTVAESKTLIAEGLKRYAPVAQKLQKGTILIAKGTTGAYLYEAFSGKTIVHGDYVNGYIKPANGKQGLSKTQAIEELALKDGQAHHLPYPEVLEQMLAGDIIFKGANIINYQKKQAGVMILHPTGGTCGTITPAIETYNLHLIIPVGLEKDSSEDIDLLSEKTKKLAKTTGNSPWLWTLKGELFTEIEALQQWAKVDIEVIGKGGVAGAEGAVTFCVSGKKEEVEQAMLAVKKIQGNGSYVK